MPERPSWIRQALGVAWKDLRIEWHSREILYIGGLRGEGLMSVSYRVKGDALVPDKPRVWTANRGGSEFDLAPDGAPSLAGAGGRPECVALGTVRAGYTS